MATIANATLEPVRSYPVFSANQLLSNRDLNDVVEYLDHQTRATRLCTTGAGIVCGLGVRRVEQGIEISAGCGVTSEGFLVRLETCVVRHGLTVELAQEKFLGTGAASSDAKVEVQELFENAQEGTEPLELDAVLDQVVVLLLECTLDPGEICIDDCDAQGARREFSVRKLLLKRDVARKLLRDAFNPGEPDGRRRFEGWTLDDLLIGRYGVDDLYIERFGHTRGEDADAPQVKLTEIRSYEDFVDRYKTILGAGAERAIEALERAHKMFSPVFSGKVAEPLPTLLRERFEFAAEDPLKRKLTIQYVYGHLADLVRAYNEFRAVTFDLMDVCTAHAGWFSKHLFLGLVTDDGIDPSTPVEAERTPAVQPPAYNDNRRRVGQARVYFQRLKALLSTFDVPTEVSEDGILITPSRWGNAPLGDRAIPYYYRKDPDGDDPVTLAQAWSADLHRRGRDRHALGYHYRSAAPGSDAGPRFDEPLAYDLEGHDFYRIEGHVGLLREEVFERITELRGCYNLGFDIAVVKLGEVNEELVDFVCDFEALETQYVKLRSDIICAQNSEPGSGQQFGPEHLPESLSAFDYGRFEARFVHLVGPTGCFFGYAREPFKELAELAQRRKTALEALETFHKFAEKHPGMEHRAGVPRGGTFVLVYDDFFVPETEKTVQRVVGDFCLPYMCCSPCPPTAYVMARPRPVFRIDPFQFCANDSGQYRFRTDPEGGVVTGPGVHFDAEGYFFRPSDSGRAQGPVQLTYTVDGADATTTVQILPVPQAVFTLKEEVCHNALVRLVLSPGTATGGKFTTDIDPGNPDLGIVKDPEGATFLDASAKSDGGPVVVTYEVRAETGCSGRSTAKTLVRPEPNAGFALPPHFCTQTEPFPLEADEPNLTSVFKVIVEGEVAQEIPGPGTFVPAKVPFEGLSVKIEIRHEVKDSLGCKSSKTKTTTIFTTPPPGRFSVGQVTREDDVFVIPIAGIEPANPPGLRYVFRWTDANGLREEVRLDASGFGLKVRAASDSQSVTLSMTVLNGECRSPRGEAVSVTLPSGPVEPPGPSNPLEVRRREHEVIFEGLASSHAGLDTTTSFRLVSKLAQEAGREPAETTVEEFKELLPVILPNYKRAKTTGENPGSFQKLTEVATVALLDAVGLAPPSGEVQETASVAFRKVTEADLDPQAVLGEWLTSELASSLTQEGRDAVRSLLS